MIDRAEMISKVHPNISTALQLANLPNDGNRYELIDGVLYMMSPSGNWEVGIGKLPDAGFCEAFERVLEKARQRVALPTFGYEVMPNRWHFVARPSTKTQVIAFFRWLTHTHTMRWHAHRRTEGTSHLYQVRFKTFPIEEGSHLLSVLRYVDRNP